MSALPEPHLPPDDQPIDRVKAFIVDEANQKNLIKLVSRFLRSAHDQEEIVQETFYKALENRAELDSRRGANAVRSWINTVAINLAIDKLRDHARHPICHSSLLDLTPSKQSAVGSNLIFQDLLQHLDAELDNLSAGQRRALKAYVQELLTTPKVDIHALAESIKMSRETFSSHKSQAINQLQKSDFGTQHRDNLNNK